ncbi:hypothetical protein WJ16_28595 [Burkholderia metallica]|nr:hypothetical protein WJ16_28595 [Burkholderia metallica]
MSPSVSPSGAVSASSRRPRSRNPFVVGREHCASRARDIATARDVGAAIRFMPPPGWRSDNPDNPGETTEELRRRRPVAVRTDA